MDKFVNSNHHTVALEEKKKKLVINFRNPAELGCGLGFVESFTDMDDLKMLRNLVMQCD